MKNKRLIGDLEKLRRIWGGKITLATMLRRLKNPATSAGRPSKAEADAARLYCGVEVLKADGKKQIDAFDEYAKHVGRRSKTIENQYFDIRRSYVELIWNDRFITKFMNEMQPILLPRKAEQ